MKNIGLFVCLLSLVACKSRESALSSAIEPEIESDPGVVSALTPIPGYEISPTYARAFNWNVERAIEPTGSVAELVNADLECSRQLEALMNLFFLEINNPRGFISSDAGNAIELARTKHLFEELNKTYKLSYPSVVRHESKDRFVIVAKDAGGQLESPEQVYAEKFEQSLAALNNQDVDETGLRLPLESSCADKKVHAARLINLQIRFPGVINGEYKLLTGFEPRMKNIELILSDLRKVPQ